MVLTKSKEREKSFFALLSEQKSLGQVDSEIHDSTEYGPGIRDAGGSCSINITRQSTSGQLITNPVIVLWTDAGHYWGGIASDGARGHADHVYYDTALNTVVNDSGFWNRLSEYGINGGSVLAGDYPITRGGLYPVNPDGSVTEQTIQANLSFRLNETENIDPTNWINVILLSPGITSQYDTSSNFIGHHQIYYDSSLGKNIVYAVVEYSTNRTQTLSVITHEIYEAATDPDLHTGYFDPAHGGEEVGDACNLQTEVIAGYPVQKVWSQNACGCV